MNIQTSRVALVRTGVRIELFTVLWMVMEAAVSIGAGLLDIAPCRTPGEYRLARRCG